VTTMTDTQHFLNNSDIRHSAGFNHKDNDDDDIVDDNDRDHDDDNESSNRLFLLFIFLQ